MRRLSVLLSLPIAGLVLSSSVAGTAHAAPQGPREHPWSAYFPAEGVTCAVQVSRDGVVEGTGHTTVVEKSARKVVVQYRGSGRIAYQLQSGGRMRTAESGSSGGSRSGYRTHASVLTTLPSPSALAHHDRGQQKVTMNMTVPKRVAHLLLVRGNALRIVGDYPAVGLGVRETTLADSEGTPVNAVGYRIALRSLKVTNIKPRYRQQLVRELRPTFADFGYTDWTARTLGDVLLQQRDSGSFWTARMIGCGDDVRTARPGAGAATRHFSGRLDAVPPAVVRALGRGLRS
ncbi:hypothetical protein [Nocardioides sp.]|uniref:hypothetical protein n=1 Tax=Nocardioides sp. TaxID=35761 RepID=UPI0037835EF8